MRYTVNSLKGSDEKKVIVSVLQTNDIEKAKRKMKSEAKNVDMYAGVTITDNKTGNMKVYRGFSLLEKVHDLGFLKKRSGFHPRKVRSMWKSCKKVMLL